MKSALKPEIFRALYKDFAAQNPAWNEIPSSVGDVYRWDAKSTYIQEPPFFENFSMTARHDRRHPGRLRARHLRRFGDHRPHLACRQHQEGFARRANTSSSTAFSPPISTATARAAATTA